MNGANGAAALYHNADQATRHFAIKALEEFADVMAWRSDGRDSVLDAGCGPGDITAEILLPFLPATFERVVGVDICEKMISYARHTHSHPRLRFEVMNLDVELTKQIFTADEPFDHIFSFFCLMWIRNQKLCVQNFHQLLKKGGDMLLVFLTHHPVYDFYKSQSKYSQWAKYVCDFDQFITPYQNSADPVDEFSKILEDCGFTNRSVKLETINFVTEGVQNTYDFYRAVNPFIDRIPEEDKQNYMDDLMLRFAPKYTQDICNMDSQICRYNVPAQIIVAYARK